MFKMLFPVSKVSTFVLLPPLVALLLAYFGAMAGVTGAFLLLPFQMSVLGYIAPGVSATNFTYNIIAIPGTVFRYAREGRMNWPLASVITMGSLPGIVFGYFLRIRYLTDPRFFKPFVGLVLLYLAWIVGNSIFKGSRKKTPPPVDAKVTCSCLGVSRISYQFAGMEYTFDPRGLFMIALCVGVVGGAYGLGGGAILAPFCIAVLRLPVHSVAGASLFGTFMSSLVGVLVYHAGFFSEGLDTRPDYLLGALFGLGGALGGYLGAKTQKHIPEQPIKIGLLVVLLFTSVKYMLELLK